MKKKIKLDADGKPVLDAEGKPIMIDVEDDDDDNNDDDFALEQIAKLKKEKLELKRKNKELSELMSSNKNDTAEMRELKNQLNELLEYKRQSEEDAEKRLLDGKKNDWERIEYQLNKKITELQNMVDSLKTQLSEKEALLTEKESTFKKEASKARELNLKSRLRTAAVNAKAYSPEQVIALIISDFIYDEENDDYIYPIYNNKGKLVDEKTPEEYVKEFLTRPENDNLIKADIHGGSGSSNNSDDQSNNNKEIIESGKDKTKIKITDQIKREAKLVDMTPEVYIEMLEQKEAILAAKREKRKDQDTKFKYPKRF